MSNPFFAMLFYHLRLLHPARSGKNLEPKRYALITSELARPFPNNGLPANFPRTKPLFGFHIILHFIFSDLAYHFRNGAMVPRPMSGRNTVGTRSKWPEPQHVVLENNVIHHAKKWVTLKLLRGKPYPLPHTKG